MLGFIEDRKPHTRREAEMDAPRAMPDGDQPRVQLNSGRVREIPVPSIGTQFIVQTFPGSDTHFCHPARDLCVATEYFEELHVTFY